jgi:hypothetical protein
MSRPAQNSAASLPSLAALKLVVHPRGKVERLPYLQPLYENGLAVLAAHDLEEREPRFILELEIPFSFAAGSGHGIHANGLYSCVVRSSR